ncbi:MAG: HPr family phosphocarrier protein [Lachnospiraceae bacterium]|jgi:phosphocarrier protein HPr|nr:HPr family phosphocarrier protein [Lachnospiraceae bacterium]
MTVLKISLVTIDQVKKFVDLVSKVEGDVDLVSGRYTIDAKSIMGIFSLDISKPMELRIYREEGELEELLMNLKEFQQNI